MRQRNILLACIALGLLAVSIAAYHYTESRGDRFERGRKLLANLNPDEVAAIRIQEGASAEGEGKLTLERRGESFRIAERDGYAAKNEAVNRLLKTLLDVTLEKEVGSGDALAKKLELEPPGEGALDIALEGESGKTMVHLRFGGELEGGGVYVQRLDTADKTIYLTSSRPFLDTAPEDFLKKEIVDVAASGISRIEGSDFVVEEVFEEGEASPEGMVASEAGESAEGGVPAAPPAPPEPVSLGLQLAGVPDGKSEKASEMSRVKGALSRLEFEEVYPADSPEVADLDFQQRLRVSLDDTSGYVVFLADKGEAHYLRIEGFSTVGQVAIGRDESEDELKVKADSLSRSDEIQDFNAFHGSWVYTIADRFAEKLLLNKSDLVE